MYYDTIYYRVRSCDDGFAHSHSAAVWYSGSHTGAPCTSPHSPHTLQGTSCMFSLLYWHCLWFFIPVHLQVRLEADAVFYLEGQAVLPRPAPPPSLVLPSLTPYRHSLNYTVLPACHSTVLHSGAAETEEDKGEGVV